MFKCTLLMQRLEELPAFEELMRLKDADKSCDVSLELLEQLLKESQDVSRDAPSRDNSGTELLINRVSAHMSM